LAIDPKELYAHYVLAKLEFGLHHDPAEAKKHVQVILAAADGYTARTMQADLAEATKDKKAMRAALEKAAQFDPMLLDPLIDLYKIAVEDKRDDDALVLLRKMVTMDAHERVPWNKLLEALAKKSLWDEILKNAEGAIYVDPYSPTVHAMIARAYTMTGKLKEANDEIDAGLDAKPKGESEAILHVERARAAWKAKDVAKAKSELDVAAKLDPKSQDVTDLRSQL
ncbi:MAG: tetratricopeptide repeat protein, partial [Polyangiales bacterium]